MKKYTEAEIQGATEAYAEFHAETIEETGLSVVVDRNYEGGTENVIGFRLSLDSDNHSHGCDETYGEW